MDNELDLQARELAKTLIAEGAVIATAESCTGGWVATVLTGIEGSSLWFDRGFVTYSNESKQQMLGVAAETIAAQGAVSGATVGEMVKGVLNNSRASVALSISGIAGPGGGTAEKPVGTVWLAWKRKGEEPVARRMHFAGDREAVRRQAVLEAINGVLRLFDQT